MAGCRLEAGGGPSAPRARAARGLGRGALLTALLCVLPLAGETILVQMGTEARYLANRSDPGLGLAWIDPDFDDGAWAAGPYGIGYNAGGMIRTEVPEGTRSVYTRVAFQVADPARVQNVYLGLDYDDGATAWINGAEVYRSGSMPGGDPAWDASPANHESSNGNVPDYDPLRNITASAKPALRAGVNVLAIGVWNVSATSSDLALVPRLSINREGGGQGTEVCGTLAGDRVWTAAESPYVVACSVMIPKGSSLRIEPGVEVRFAGRQRLVVRGELEAEGTEDARIRFTRDTTSGWDGILIDHRGDGDPRPSRIRFADLERASTLLEVVGTGPSEILIEDCAFDHWSHLAVRWDEASGVGANGLILRRCAFGLATPASEADHEAINGYHSSAIVEDSIFGRRRGYNDCIDLAHAHADDANGVPTVRRSIFLGGEDDAIDFDDSDGIIEGNLIQHHRPDGTSPPIIPGTLPPPGHGANGGGITGNEGSSPIIRNNRIYDCFQGIGYKNGAEPLIVNNTIVGCAFGVVIFRTGDIGNPTPAHATLINNIIWGCGDPVRLKWYDDDPEVSSVDVLYCDVEGGWPGDGNIDADPLLADPEGGDFGLRAGSPAIDAGLADARVTDRDAAGMPRVDDPSTPNTGAGTPDFVDMGALERQAEGPPGIPFRRGDANGDGAFDLSDAIASLAYLFASGSVPCLKACDTNADGVLDIGDAVGLLAYLFVGGPPPRDPFEACGTDASPLGCDAPTGGCGP